MNYMKMFHGLQQMGGGMPQQQPMPPQGVPWGGFSQMQRNPQFNGFLGNGMMQRPPMPQAGTLPNGNPFPGQGQPPQLPPQTGMLPNGNPFPGQGNAFGMNKPWRG